MIRLQTVLILLLAALLAVGCGDDSISPTIEEQPFEPAAPVNPQPAGDRLLGVTVSASENGFPADFAEARTAGTQFSEVFLAWNTVETAEGVYEDPEGIIASTAFYAAEGHKVLLVLAPLDTAGPLLPAYLADENWDARTLGFAFNDFVDWVLASLPESLEVVGISIGNEVNLGVPADEQTAFLDFLDVAVSHVQTALPDTPVGAKTTVADGLFGSSAGFVRAVNEITDVVMLNYYLLDNQFQVRPTFNVHNEFSAIAGEFSGREVWFTEVGFPSGNEHCGSSEDKQAAFFHEVFTAWDNNLATFKLLNINWLNDASAAQVAAWAQYYGSSQPGFLEFLGTLGVRTHAGEDKNAWLQIKAETGARGWSSASLPINR